MALFKPGQSGNPHGRPPVKRDLVKQLEEAGAIEKAVKILVEALDNNKTKFEAAKYLIEQVYGKPVQKNELGGEDGNPINIIIESEKVGILANGQSLSSTGNPI